MHMLCDKWQQYESVILLQGSHRYLLLQGSHRYLLIIGQTSPSLGYVIYWGSTGKVGM